MRRALWTALACLAAWSCVSTTLSPPAFHIEDVPQAVSTRLPLDQRLTAGEAWDGLKKGRPDQARKLLLKLGPDSPVYSVGLGYVSLSGGDLGAAETQFKDSLSRYPDMTPANAGLAQVYEGRGEKESAFAQYRAILERDPDNAWAKPRFEALRREAVAALLAEARTAGAAGRKDEARRALEKAAAYDPASQEANYLLGLSLLEAGDFEGARVRFDRIAGSDPEALARQRKVLRALAEGFYGKGEFGRSLDSYEKLAELEPQDKAVAARVAELKDKLGVYELPSQYGLIASEGAITREDLAALIAVKFKAFLDLPEAQTQILVDISTSWAQAFIIRVASHGIMGTSENHTFEPRRIINRADLAQSLAALVDLLKARGVRLVPLLDTRRIHVADVPPNSFYFTPILKVISYQVMDLTPQRTFEPERTVPGREAVRALDTLLGLAK